MKFVCETSSLSLACQNVQRAVSSKSSIPGAEGILIKTTVNGLSLTGYDLEIGINTNIYAFCMDCLLNLLLCHYYSYPPSPDSSALPSHNIPTAAESI